MRAGDVANWDAPKGARVDFDFEVRGKLWTIYRTHSPNTWRLRLPEDEMGPDGLGCEVDLADKGEEGLAYGFTRLDYEPFLNTVLMAQGEGMFLDLRPEPKAALFSTVMGLDRWADYSKRAGEKADSADLIVRAAEREVADLEGQLRAGTRDLSEESARWESERSARRIAVEDEYASRIDRATGLREAQDRAEDEVEGYGEQPGLQAILRLRIEAQETHAAKLKTHADEHRNLDAEWRSLESQLDAAERKLRAAADTGTCPTCGQALPKEADDRHIRVMERERAVLASAAKSASEEVSKALRQLQRVEEEGRRLTRMAQEALDGLGEGRRLAQDARIAYEANERRMDELEDLAGRINNEGNPFERLQEQARADRERIAARLDEAQRRRTDAAERYAKLCFWVRGFKDVRLQLIAESLEHLAIEVNSCVTALGLVGWDLVFEVDRETKGKTVSRGFSVFVRSPRNARAVPWESWSGGESQRLRLAAQMGLANLIRASTGSEFALEVWDEPTNGMNAGGIDDLLAALRERAKREHRQIWVVDHHALGHGGFDGGVTVIRDDEGSRFEI